MTRLFVPLAAALTLFSVRPLPARIHDTRLPPPQFVVGVQSCGAALWPASKTAFSAWKVWPRNTLIGEFQVMPRPVQETAPSLPACIVQCPEVMHLRSELRYEFWNGAPLFWPRRPGTTLASTPEPSQ